MNKGIAFKAVTSISLMAFLGLSTAYADSKVSVSKSGAEVPYKVLSKTKDNVEIRKGGFGSDACAFPGDNSKFYLITDRGPNIDYKGPQGKGKLFPVPEFNPEIGLFQFTKNGTIKKLKSISLKNPDGKKITGLPNPKGKGATGEIAYDLNDNVLGLDEYGLDSEGIVAMNDGSFWISDEYGPHIVHFSAEGIELERMSPHGMTTNGRKIPAVLAKRRANRGITALTNDEFVVIERDGKFADEGEAHKYLYKINLKDATDVNGDMTAESGILISGKTLEQCTKDELTKAGINFVSKELITDLVKEINYGHDKLEGLWLLDDHTICVANDNDFSLIEKENKLCQKILPGTGRAEDDVIYSLKF